jgi:hypothetical protein
MEALVPYGFERDLLPATSGLILPGQVRGIYITLHPEVTEEITAKIARWFEGRDDVMIVDHGTSDKQGFGFLLMEWIECEIDPLFLAILRDEETVGDYTVYGRTMEE